MDTQIHRIQTVDKLLEQLEEATPARQDPKMDPRQDRDPEPFAFSTAVDKVGLRFESPAYIKKSCRDCYGRGYQTFLVGDGYWPKAPGHVGERIPRKARDLRACRCVIKGYVRARMAHDALRPL